MPRRSIDPPGKPLHPQPFPAATRIGNLIFSSAISGMDLASGELPAAVEDQVDGAFANVAATLREAGASLADIAKMTVYVRDRVALRDVVNRRWVALFPDPADRPVRHMVVAPLAGDMQIQLEFVAVVDA